VTALKNTMNVVDRVVSYFNPVAGARRLRGRAVMAMAGGYDAARHSRRHKNWKPGGSDADGDILSDLPEMRERSRDLVRNSPLAAGVLNIKQTHVIGTGLNLQSRINADALGMSGDEADAWQERTEQEFLQWAESTHCDLGNNLSFFETQGLAYRSALESGDALALLAHQQRDRELYGLKIQLIEGDRLSNPGGKGDTATTISGVERSKYGEPQRYHIQDQHPGNRTGAAGRSWTGVDAFTDGRQGVIHLMKQLRPGQTRGVPDLASATSHFKMLKDYTDYELDAARLAGSFAVFVYSEIDKHSEDTPLGLKKAGGDSKEDVELTAGGLSMVNLDPGERVESHNPGRPNSEFDPFVFAIIKQIATSVGVPVEVLVMHYLSSYSASRAALLEMARTVNRDRFWFANQFCRPVYQTWLAESVASGRTKAPGFFADPARRAAWSGSVWNGDSMGHIDETKAANAAILRVGAGFTTMTEETLAMTGGDFSRNINRIKREIEKKNNAGLGALPGTAIEGKTDE
jgi:lambda family phage portal protein